MRFYSISIGGDKPVIFTSLPNGIVDPGALRVEMDIPVTSFATPAGNPRVKIWGVGIDLINYATNYDNVPISVYGGMGPGLPLAQAAFKNGQLGLLTKGLVFQAYGNWIGTEQSLDFIIMPGQNINTVDTYNIYMSWLKGQPMDAAIKACMAAAYPEYAVVTSINPNVVAPSDQSGLYTSLEQLSRFVKRKSQEIVNSKTYNGVDIYLRDNTLYITDGTPPPGATITPSKTSTAPKLINYYDLVGQPTWIDFPKIQFSTVMRADLHVSDQVMLPPGQYTRGVSSRQDLRNKTAQTGVFTILDVRHVGNSRAPGAQNWISVFNAIPAPPSAPS